VQEKLVAKMPEDWDKKWEALNGVTSWFQHQQVHSAAVHELYPGFEASSVFLRRPVTVDPNSMDRRYRDCVV
jgi:hypothetical protein